MIGINGLAHVILTVSRFEACKEFYKQLLPNFGMKLVFDGDNFYYHVGARTAIGIQRCAADYAQERFVKDRVGLHHVSFRARSSEDVDKTYQLLEDIGATIVHAPEIGHWAPGYYSVLFEDPDGIRLEVNYVPDVGLLEVGAMLRSTGDYT